MGLITELIQRNCWEELEEWLVAPKSQRELEALSAELSRVDRLGRMPLHYACAKKGAPPPVIGLMLEKSAMASRHSLARHDICGNTLLHSAAACGNAQVLRVVLEKCALHKLYTIRQVNDVGMTPLMMAWKKHLYSVTLFGDVRSLGRVSPLICENIRFILQIKTIKDLQAPKMERLRDLWDKTCIICYAAQSPSMYHPICESKLWRPLHSLVTVGGNKQVQCPTIALWLAIHLYSRHELSLPDEEGNLPLHLASANAEMPILPLLMKELDPLRETSNSATQLLVQAYPEAARVGNNVGQLPLHIAISTGKPFDTVISTLQRAAPETVEQIDPLTCLPPVLQAAATRKCPLSVLYELLRAHPEVVLLNSGEIWA